MTRWQWNCFTQDLSQRSSSRVNYVNFISGSLSPSLSLSLSLVFLRCLSRIFPLSLALSFNNRPLDDFVAPQIANIVRTSANPNQRRRSRRCSINVALEFLRVYRCTWARLWLVHTTLLPRESSPFAQFISFHQELLNLARGGHGLDYKRLR